MGEKGRGGLLRRVARALAGQADEARRAAVERTSAKYPDAYPPGYVERERQAPEPEGEREERDDR